MRVRTIILACIVPLCAATPSRADVVFTPFVGANLNGTTAVPVGTLVGSSSQLDFGASVAVMSGGVFGVEADVGYSPKFFGTGITIAGVPVSLARNNVTTVMVNVTAGVPIQGRSGAGFRPYGVAGIGLIRQQLELVGGVTDYSTSDLGYDVGGGAMLFLGEHVGIRGDLRYFRTSGSNPFASLVNLQVGSFSFTRASVGVTLRY